MFTRVLAGIIIAAKAQGTPEAPAAGYRTVYFPLAGLSAVDLVIAHIVKRPAHPVGGE